MSMLGLNYGVGFKAQQNGFYTSIKGHSIQCMLTASKSDRKDVLLYLFQLNSSLQISCYEVKLKIFIAESDVNYGTVYIPRNWRAGR